MLNKTKFKKSQNLATLQQNAIFRRKRIHQQSCVEIKWSLRPEVMLSQLIHRAQHLFHFLSERSQTNNPPTHLIQMNESSPGLMTSSSSSSGVMQAGPHLKHGVRGLPSTRSKMFTLNYSNHPKSPDVSVLPVEWAGTFWLRQRAALHVQAHFKVV